MNHDANGIKQTQTGGRPATSGLIRGRYSLSVGMPSETPPDGWSWLPLSELARLETGHTPSRKHHDYWDGDFCWIGIKDATSNHGRTLTDTFQHITRLGLENSSARLLPKNTVCLSRTASVGYVVVMGKEMATSQDFVNWVCSENLDHDFLKYILLSERDSFLRFASGTTHQTIYFPEAKAFHVCIPPIGEQKAIAHILATLDDKIELNRKTNETLEAMAKALFQSWFVDFDPVRAKAEGRPTGLPDEISDLFPDSFEESELGDIPRGWRDGEIQDVAELNPETWGSKNQPLRVKYLDLSNVKYGKIDCIEEYKWEFAPSRAKRVLKIGDTVVGTVRPGNGSYCLIGEDGITGSTGFAVLRPKNKNDDVFVYLGSCSKENIDRLAHLADGGAYPAVRPELIAQTPVVVATREVLDCFSIRVSPLFAASEKGRQESKVLCQVRDTLLPKLISGELRIPEAEKLVSDLG
jgi:type I restriction enzyme S subunit